MTSTQTNGTGSAGVWQLFKDLDHQFGLDKPLGERFLTMIGHYARFDFGQSFFRNGDVMHLILQRLPVSIEQIASAVDVAALKAATHERSRAAV